MGEWRSASGREPGGAGDVVSERHAEVQVGAVDLQDAPVVVWEESVIGDQGKSGVRVHAKRSAGVLGVRLFAKRCDELP